MTAYELYQFTPLSECPPSVQEAARVFHSACVQSQVADEARRKALDEMREAERAAGVMIAPTDWLP